MRIANLKNIFVLFVTLAVSIAVVVITLGVSYWRPEGLIRPGSRYFNGTTYGEEGYDGQFSYAIALDMNPSTVKNKLDSPAYRYQRILYPILARLFSLGNLEIIPWVLIFLPIVGQLVGTCFVLLILNQYSANPAYALVYGLGAGFLLSIRLALPEPIAYGFAMGALYFTFRNKHFLGAIFLALAIFTKEVTIVFGVAFLVALFLEKNYFAILKIVVIAFLPFVFFQVWLWRIFGQIGIASGGAMATPFEWVPFMGLFRIGEYSVYYMIMMMVAFFPLVILPAIAGTIMSLKVLVHRDYHLINISLLLHSFMMFFLPFSTYRETGGILRLSCGLIAMFLLFCAKHHYHRILKYLPWWIVYNVFLVK